MPDEAPVTIAIFLSSLGMNPSCKHGPAAHDQISQRHLHGFVVLVQRRGPHLDNSLVGMRFRCSYLEHFAFDPKLIPRPDGSWPAEFVKPGANYTASGFDIAFDQESHRDRGGVPAACGETSKYR